MITLRDYQTEAVSAVLSAWDSGTQRTAVVLPTGTGKTVIFSGMIDQLITSGHRPLVLVHRDELVRQTEAQLAALVPAATVGVVKADRNEYQSDRDVVIGSVQTIGRCSRLDRVSTDRFDRVIVDECHHASAAGYRRIMETFGMYDPAATDRCAAGFTATLARGDSRGLGDVWQSVSYQQDMLWAIEHGHLVDIRCLHVTIDGLDLTGVQRSHGDYQADALGDAMISAGAGSPIADAYAAYATRKDRPGFRPGILFAPNIASAEQFASDFNAAGIRTEVVIGDTPIAERHETYRRLAAGEIDVIASCMVLTEGFDLPEVEVVVIARPTSSAPLFTQMIGRGARLCPWTGKTECLVLDVSGVSGHHKLASLVDLSDRLTGEITPEDGESLAELSARVQDSKRLVSATAQALATEVDLFGRSRSAWLQTATGTWFVPTRSGYVFLAPDRRPDAVPGTVLIGKTSTQYAKRGPASHRYALGSHAPVAVPAWGWIRDGLTMELAMPVAEQIASELDPSVSSRKANWRSASRLASGAQIQQLQRIGMDYTTAAGMSRSDASDALSVAFASRVLDAR